MIEVSNIFKYTAREPIKTIRASVVFNGEVYSSFDYLISIKKDDTGFYFGVATKCVTITLLGTNYDLVNKNTLVNFEILTDPTNNIWERCDLGEYIIQSQTIDLEKDITVLKGYDKIGVMGLSRYESNGLTFNTTVANLIEQIANKFNLGYIADTLPNDNYVIEEDLYTKINGITYRDILAELAGATATIARDSNNILEMHQLEKTETGIETLTYNNLRKVKLEQLYGPVNSVVLARTPQEDNVAISDQESIEQNGLTEIKLANNEILDDNREGLIQPLLDAVNGFSFYPFEAITEGHGWYEVGDRVRISDGVNVWSVIITEISLIIDGGVREIIKGVAPTETKTNYALAGGIVKTIHNTEIKVDKQKQQIASIVAEQSILENQVNENHTTVTQNISNIITSVQNSGGNNLIKNSAMYSLDNNGKPLSWTLTNGGFIVIAPSAEAAVNGSLSRQNISLKDKAISQTIDVKADNSSITEKTYYSFSCKIKKTAVGRCSVRITDGTEHGVWKIELENGDESFYGDHSIEGILPNASNLVIEVYGSSDSEFSITDMMLSVGNYKTQWTQANGEFANMQVTIDNNGVVIRSNTLTGTYTKQTPQEVSVYSNNVLSATVNGDEIIAPKAKFKNEISMSPIKIVPQSDGWAFVRKEN